MSTTCAYTCTCTYRYNFILPSAFELDKKKSDAKESDLLDILMLDLVHADAVDRKVSMHALNLGVTIEDGRTE